uniref:chemokine-like receptor 1 n=1 Tax=Monopterus albus TaxID=43700 RepID=UPI0009B3248D|nr:chemokine-like receptor 1 [Monopterus albus]
MANGNTTSTPAGVDNVIRNLRIASVAIYCVVVIVGTVGNGLVIYVTAFRMKRTVNSVWFLNLAIADFLFLAFLIFTIISFSQEYHWPFGLVMCKLNNFVTVVTMFASIFLLMAISLDRCLSVWVVVWAQNKRTVRKAVLISVAIWVAAVICSTPYAIFRLIWSKSGKTFCSYPITTPMQSLVIFRFSMGFLIPFLAILASYVAIGARARRLQRRNRQRSCRIIFSIILAFFICWLPYHVMSFIELRVDRRLSHIKIAGSLTVCLAYTNSCLNPILYVFMCHEFQNKLKQSICFVLENALAEDHLSFMSSRSMSSHLSRISRKSDSAAPVEKSTSTSLKSTESKVVFSECRENTEH